MHTYVHTRVHTRVHPLKRAHVSDPPNYIPTDKSPFPSQAFVKAAYVARKCQFSRARKTGVLHSARSSCHIFGLGAGEESVDGAATCLRGSLSRGREKFWPFATRRAPAGPGQIFAGRWLVSQSRHREQRILRGTLFFSSFPPCNLVCKHRGRTCLCARILYLL